MRGLSAQTISVYDMARSRGQRRRRGGANNRQLSNLGAGSTRTVSVSYNKPIKESFVAGVDSNAFPALEPIIGGNVEWKITQAVAEYSSLDPLAKGIVALMVCPHDWSINSVDAIVSSGGVQFPASSVRRSTPSFGGFGPDWHGVGSAAASLSVGTFGVDAGVGRVVLRLTIQVRGVSS